jgi:hypothetical protein
MVSLITSYFQKTPEETEHMNQVFYRKIQRSLLRLGALIMVVVLSVAILPDSSQAVSPMARRKVFNTPKEGVNAMIAAMRADDIRSLLVILGSYGKELVTFGDPIADKKVREAFLKAYSEQNRIELIGETKAILHTGKNDWPFPMPLIQRGQTWHFDSKAGKEEVQNADRPKRAQCRTGLPDLF